MLCFDMQNNPSAFTSFRHLPLHKGGFSSPFARSNQNLAQTKVCGLFHARNVIPSIERAVSNVQGLGRESGPQNEVTKRIVLWLPRIRASAWRGIRQSPAITPLRAVAARTTPHLSSPTNRPHSAREAKSSISLRGRACPGRSRKNPFLHVGLRPPCGIFPRDGPGELAARSTLTQEG